MSKTKQTEQRRCAVPTGSAHFVMHAYVRGRRYPLLETLTPSMWECLWNACWKNGAQGSKATVAALERRGLMNAGKITQVGLDASLVEWRYPSPNAKAEPRAAGDAEAPGSNRVGL